MSIARAILHVGTYKTGSTSLQNTLYENRAILKKNGILFPLTGLRTETPHLGYRHTELILDHLHNGRSAFPEALRTELTDTCCETVILSSEAWSAGGHQSHLTQFVHALREFGVGEIHCVVAFRNITDYAQRLYREFTTNQRNKHRYRDYIKQNGQSLDYLFLANNLRMLFGNKLEVIDYDGTADVIEAIFKRVGLEFDWTSGENVRQNRGSFNAVTAEFARHCNRLKKKQDVARSSFQALLVKRPGLMDKNWTERYVGDLHVQPESYVRAFAEVTGLDHDIAQRILRVKPVEGQPIKRLSKPIMNEILAVSP